MKIEKDCVIRMSAGQQNNYTNETDDIHDWVLKETNNEELAIDASSWCELATVGETYDGGEFTLTIQELY